MIEKVDDVEIWGADELIGAVEKKDYSSVAQLLEFVPPDSRDEYGRTPLHHCHGNQHA